MNEVKCKKFLMNIFMQAYVDESFFDLIKKIGLDFSKWPKNPCFDVPKKFWSTANVKSYNAALIEFSIEVPDTAFQERISETEIKIYYEKYLNFLLAKDLVKEISHDPEQAHKLCKDFLENKTTTTKYFNLESEIKNFVFDYEEKSQLGQIEVVLSMFPLLSKTISGFNPGRVSILTAYSGFGKTNFGINFLVAAMQDGKNCLYINMEMDPSDMVKRTLQATCKISSSEFKNGNYISAITNGAQSLINAKNNYFTDGSALSLVQINQIILEIKRKQNLHFLIVDYDQKLVMNDYGIEQEWMAVKKAVETLEEIAKREVVHVLLFAQTNEESQGMPIASRRAIQPASSVIQFTKENDIPVLKFLKNRFGPVSEKIKLIYDPSKSVIIEDGYYQPAFEPPKTGGFKPRYS